MDPLGLVFLLPWCWATQDQKSRVYLFQMPPGCPWSWELNVAAQNYLQYLTNAPLSSRPRISKRRWCSFVPSCNKKKTNLLGVMLSPYWIDTFSIIIPMYGCKRPCVGDLSLLKHCHLATEVEKAEIGVLNSSCCSWTHVMYSLLPSMASLILLKYLKQQPVKAEQQVKTREHSWQQKLLLQELGMVLAILCVAPR